MPNDNWPTKSLAVVNLHLDDKNPRLGRETSARAPREIIEHLFEHDKAFEVAESIVARGYFPNEPLLAIKENGKFVVVEGNRRLAALKALREPGLLDAPLQRRVERLSKRLPDPREIATVPVTIAPTRRATDKLIAGRHVGTPVLPWRGENRASFILEKLDEGYSNEGLRDQLGFSLADIQEARQTRAIADMARSLDLPEEIKAKLDNPKAKVFTTLERVFNSSAGREYLHVKPDPEHGIRGETTRNEFILGFTKLVMDVALGKQSSRSLNKTEDIEKYFRSWPIGDRPKKKQGSFVPSDVIVGKSVASALRTPGEKSVQKRSIQPSPTVLPRDFKVRFGNDRLIDIRRELVKLKRTEFPNAGAVLLRVFLELSAVHYLKRVGAFETLVSKLSGKGKLPYDTPTMKQLVPELTRIAKEHLSSSEAKKVEKAIRYDDAAPFTVSDLHAFVHSSDLPGERDILQFWLRTEPLFRLMLEREPEEQQE